MLNTMKLMMERFRFLILTWLESSRPQRKTPISLEDQETRRARYFNLELAIKGARLGESDFKEMRQHLASLRHEVTWNIPTVNAGFEVLDSTFDHEILKAFQKIDELTAPYQFSPEDKEVMLLVWLKKKQERAAKTVAI